MYAISTPKRFISTLKGLNYLPAEKRLSIMGKVLPQMPGIKKRLGGSPVQQRAMEMALEKAQRTFESLSGNPMPNLSDGKPKSALPSQKVSRVPSLSTVLKIGGIVLSLGVLIGFSCASTADPASVPESTGNQLATIVRNPIIAATAYFGNTFTQSHISEMVQNIDLLKLIQDLGISLHKKCGDCDDNPEASILSEASRMGFVENEMGERIWSVSDEALEILFKSGQWTPDDYLYMIQHLLSVKRYAILEKVVDNEWIKGNYLNIVNVDNLQGYVRDAAGFKILQKLICSLKNSHALFKEASLSRYAKEVLTAIGCYRN